MGNGPVVWYQIYDYAIGHWFQKVYKVRKATLLKMPYKLLCERLSLRQTHKTAGSQEEKSHDVSLATFS